MNARIYGYGRVSTADQTAENQQMELAAAGFAIPSHRWFVDTVSGKTPAMHRPAFAKLVDRAEPGDSLVVSRLDRLGRDSVDVEQTLRLLEGKRVGVIVLQLGSTDLTSTAGQLIRKVLAAVAEMGRSLLIERTKAGMVRAAAQGKAIGRPPALTAKQREEMRQRAAGGESISSLARAFGIGRTTAREALRRVVSA